MVVDRPHCNVLRRAFGSCATIGPDRRWQAMSHRITSHHILPGLGLLLAACGSAPREDGPPATATSGARPDAAPGVIPGPAGSGGTPPTARGDPAATRPAAPGAIAAVLIRREWARAANRDRCAPLGFGSDGGGQGTARRASFSGGWAVAFDRPGLRSAYGIAGAGLLPQDDAPPAEQRRRLRSQWPYFMVLDGLPQPAFAGFGVEGATRYPPGNASGNGLNSLAYVRVGGQSCTYNVWSRLGRAHLEVLLDSLQPVAKLP